MLEKFNGNKIPECVKTILRSCAYDSACSLTGLDVNRISDIEKFVNNSDGTIVNQLTCCNAGKYKSQQEFRFLPGHTSILLAIPDEIRQMNASKKKPNKKLSEFKKLMTPFELKQILLSKLNQHIGKSYFTQQFGLFTEENLSDVSTLIVDNTMTAKCNVKCMKCDVVVPILFNGSWCTSNVFRHLKSHATQVGPTESNNTANSAALVDADHSKG